MEEKIAKQIEKLKELVADISEKWECLEDSSFLEDNYPFDRSFDEMALDVAEWSAMVNKNLSERD